MPEKIQHEQSSSTHANIFTIVRDSHRSNMAMLDILRKPEDAFHSIHEIIEKLRNLDLAAKFLQLPLLHPVHINKTSWSSIYRVLVWYQKFRPHLEEMDVWEITDMLLDPNDSWEVGEFFLRLGQLDSLIKLLQTESITIRM